MASATNPPRKLILRDLAVFGARPLFSRTVHVGQPELSGRGRFFAKVAEAFDRRWVTNDGPLVRELENRLSSFLAVKHCVAVSSGTMGLGILARAMDLSGEVIVPAFTFVATAHALSWQGIRPVFCDIDPRTHAIDAAKVESLVTPRTSAILGVHTWGEPCDIRQLAALCKRHGLQLAFDAAHAFNCTFAGRKIGGFGRAEVFSFHATKFFHTFEGGAVTTNDAALASRLRLLRNFGFTGLDKVVVLGTNGKMSEVHAAMGLAALDDIDGLMIANREKYLLYRRQLGSESGLRLFAYDASELRNHQYMVAEVETEAAGISRDELLRVLHAENVLARRYFYPGCHRMEPYRSQVEASGQLAETEALVARVVVLPTGGSVTLQEIEGICSIIRVALRGGNDFVQRLRELPDP